MVRPSEALTAASAIAIGFDFDHTLGVDNGLERRALEAYANELDRSQDAQDDAVRKQLDTILADSAPAARR